MTPKTGHANRSGELSARLLFAYALPALPLAALALPFYMIVPTYYAAGLGLPIAAVGLTLLCIRLFDALSDPVIGFLADRFEARAGRRRMFFLLSLPLTTISAFMLFYPPADAGLVYLATWGGLLSIGTTWTTLPYTAWGAELTNDYAGRSRISAWREGFTLSGTLVAVLLPFMAGGGSADSGAGLAVVGLFVLIGLPFAGFLTFRFVPEPTNRSSEKLPFVKGVRLLANNRAFLRLIAAFVLNGFANAIPATLFFFFVSERLGAPDMKGPLLFLYFLAAIAGVPVALLFAARLGKHRAWSLAMIATCLIFATAGLLGPGDQWIFAVIVVLTGVLLGFDLALPPSIQADVIDQDTASTGEQRSGIYFALWSLATKLALALAVGVVFPLLQRAGFDAASSTNSDSALDTLGVLYAWLPILPKLAAIALMWNFPIDETQQQTLRRLIESRKA